MSKSGLLLSMRAFSTRHISTPGSEPVAEDQDNSIRAAASRAALSESEPMQARFVSSIGRVMVGRLVLSG